MLATHAFPFQYPNAALSISAGHEAKAMHCQSIQQEGQRKRILQGALCLLKSGSYLPFPSLSPLAKVAPARSKAGKSCSIAYPVVAGSVQRWFIKLVGNFYPWLLAQFCPSPALLCPPKLRKHSKKNTLFNRVFFLGIRQLPIFPGRRQPSIVGV